ncbi:MAG: hypothetical protein JWR80_3860 [Bradyrhizobium sp.]|nr:hypothetical protein [Bradyrhizobium sp.]
MYGSGNDIGSDVRSALASNMDCSNDTRSSSEPYCIRNGGKPGSKCVSGFVRRGRSWLASGRSCVGRPSGGTQLRIQGAELDRVESVVGKDASTRVISMMIGPALRPSMLRPPTLSSFSRGISSKGKVSAIQSLLLIGAPFDSMKARTFLRIASSSAEAALARSGDAGVIDGARRPSPYPPLPSDIPGECYTFQLPVT